MIEPDFAKSGGMVPVVAQDFETGEVFMLAYMNREAWEKTLETGYVHYWSRSRNKLWKKGETSGNLQVVKEIRFDCDGDALLIGIDQIGKAACHTGNRSCFYRVYRGGELSSRPRRKEER
jgi:phosphoribosyl-AMP cyclohydrolase